MYDFFDIFKITIDFLIILYSILITSSYMILAFVSAIVILGYFRKNSFVDYNEILSSPLSPSISVIAPAYNESLSIVENIRALLSLHYNNYEVIVVNDGSTDSTLEKIIDSYDLEKVNYSVNYQIESKEIKAIYKSRNKSFKKLIVIDKANGGKSDALNAGLNVSGNEYFIALDADSILEQDALLKLVKPFLESAKKRVIAVGGVVRIANSCTVDEGNIVKVRLPKKLLPRFQALEYQRAFLMGRMGWSKLNGLLIISGALGLFDRELTVKSGGYLTTTVGEDMELVVRMRRYMTDNNLKYKVVQIPDPLCWTEAPDNLKVHGRQRDRWTRGTIDTLKIHRRAFFNPKYGSMGLLGYPYWFFFEWLAPVVEVLGLLYFIALAFMGLPNWSFCLLLFGLVYLFSITFSAFSILFEELTFHRYEKTSDVLKMILTACFEPIIYHPISVWWALKGNFNYFVNKESSWGKMERKGFNVAT